MNLNNPSYHVGLGKGDVVKIAATQKWIGEVFFSIRSDDDHGPMFCFDGLIDLDNIKFHLIQHIQHIILEISIRLVNFVNQKNHSLIGTKRLSYLSHPNILLDISHISLLIP